MSLPQLEENTARQAEPPATLELMRESLGEQDGYSLTTPTSLHKQADKKSKDVIISKQSITEFFPLSANEDMDSKTWKTEAEWNKDCFAGQETQRNKVVNKPFRGYFYLDGSLLGATGAAHSLHTKYRFNLWTMVETTFKCCWDSLPALRIERVSTTLHTYPYTTKAPNLVQMLELRKPHKSSEHLVKFCTAAFATGPFN